MPLLISEAENTLEESGTRKGKCYSKNTFFDFIDAAKFLVKENYTSAKHLYAMGGSAGGLLVGAVMNYEPSLFNGIVAQVPLWTWLPPCWTRPFH